MTIEQATEIKRIMGVHEEANADSDKMQNQLQKEWDAMTGEEQADNPDFDQLIYEIDDLSISVSNGINSVICRLEDVSGGLKNETL